MSRVTPQTRRAAERLIEYETKEKKLGCNDGMAMAFLVCEKLRPQLASLMGRSGFRAVLSRALAVARKSCSGLEAVEVSVDGVLEGAATTEPAVKAADASEGGIRLIAQLLGLLVAFIGQSLTLGILREVWPKIPRSDFNFTPEDNP